MNVPREIVLTIISNYKYLRVVHCIRASDGCIMILTFTDEDDVDAAKQLRATSKCFAQAYGPIDITRLIGGSFGRKEYDNVMRYNSILWRDILRHEAGRHSIDAVLARMLTVVQTQCSWMCLYSPHRHKSHINARLIQDHAGTFLAAPTMIFDDVVVKKLLKIWKARADPYNISPIGISSQYALSYIPCNTVSGSYVIDGPIARHRGFLSTTHTTYMDATYVYTYQHFGARTTWGDVSAAQYTDHFDIS